MSTVLSVTVFCFYVQVDVEVPWRSLVFIFKNVNQVIRIDKCVCERIVDGFTSLQTVWRVQIVWRE